MVVKYYDRMYWLSEIDISFDMHQSEANQYNMTNLDMFMHDCQVLAACECAMTNDAKTMWIQKH